jgi:hypothetical protein
MISIACFYPQPNLLCTQWIGTPENIFSSSAITASVPDPDPYRIRRISMLLGLPDLHLDLLVTSTDPDADPDPDPSLFT